MVYQYCLLNISFACLGNQLNMSSIVTSILSSTIGLLWNKARDTTAAKLQGGGITDENVRKVVVRELSDIKTKLDGLSRKDLRSSCNFLEEGVDFLYVALGKSNLEQNVLANGTLDDCVKTSILTSGAQCQMLNEVLELSHLMGKLKVNAEGEVSEAKKRFENSRVRATDAFSNEALSIKDTILAATLRIVSQIQERLDSPEIAITGCLSVLRKLHSLSAIQDIFNVYVNGGVKSLMNKAERGETVKSVMLINYVVFQYASKFGSKYTFVLAWPTIDLADRSFNPILHWHELSTRKSMGSELTEHPSRLKLTTEIYCLDLAVNGYGDVVFENGLSVTVISKTGERKEVKLPPAYRECEIVETGIGGVAVDRNNNIYLVRWLETYPVNGGTEPSYVLYILDKNCDVKQEYKLDFLDAISRFDFVRIAINQNNNVIMRKDGDSEVFVCDNRGSLKYKFERDSTWMFSWSISKKNEIIVPSRDQQAVHIYSEEGNLKTRIKPPESHLIRGVAFHFFFGKIIVLTYVKNKESYFLLCYTEEGELETETYFCKIGNIIPQITSHPSGPVAVVNWKSISYI